jgi:hypothetical protein
MEPLENERFEDAWHRAFEGAEQPPSEDLWGRIERQLPPERGKRRPVAWAWLAAASLLLTLLAGGLGWWAGRQETPDGETRVAIPRPEAGPVAPPDAKTDLAKSGSDSRQNGPLSTPSASAPEAVQPEAVRLKPGAFTDAPATVSAPEKTPNALADKAVRSGGFTNPPVATLPRSATRSPHRAALREPVPSRSVPTEAGATLAAAPEARQRPPVAAPNGEAQRLLVDFLQNKPAAPARVAWRIRPPVLPVAQVPVVASLPLPAKSPRRPRFWASLGATPLSYDPQVRLNGSLAAVANNANSFYVQNGIAKTTSTAVAESQAALSYRFGGRLGWQLSSHWSVESGLEYLRGQSTLQSGLVLLNRSNSAATSLLENALGAKSPANGATAGYNLADISAQNVFVPRDNQLRSTFRYVSVPLQLGYRFWPEKRLEGILSAGLSGDVFLDNTLQPTNDAFLQPVRYTPADGVYRNLLWSGLAGAGLRYRLDHRWGLLLNGTFRRALASGVRGSSGVQTFPREVGVGLRLDYRF